MATAPGTRLRCEQCETEIIVVNGTDGDLSCCNSPMATKHS
ncbi:MAG: hypothetical protein ABW073_06945 [Acidimicrobiia bacterium]